MSGESVKFLREVEPGRFLIEHPLAVNAKDGSVMVYVPEGEFEMGDGKDSDCPKHRVFLSAYWIGVYCVTNAQYLKFVEATGHRAPDQAYIDTPIWKGRSFPKEKAEHPVVCVSLFDAEAYAQWVRAQLPTEAQWEKAARGPKALIYPWGNDWDATKCRHYKNKGSETTCSVQGYTQGVSGYGTYNQSGNVWEWCADWYGSGYYGESLGRDPRGPGPGKTSEYIIRGGSWDYGAPADYRGAKRDSNFLHYRRDYLGFRLVRTASQSLPS